MQSTVWGGSAIAHCKGLDEKTLTDIGESWEICGMAEAPTKVLEGEHQGKTLQELLRSYGAQFVGKKNWERFGEDFPLLIKFIDSAQDLSIQVHPDDEMAQREGDPYGKNEMWYVVSSSAGAGIVNGFKRDLTVEEYQTAMANGTLTDELNRFDARPGDCYYIPAGRIHAIGAGNFLIEVQQSSKCTYRVYDYDRKDKDGNKRELHQEKALEALSFKTEENCRTEYQATDNNRVALVDVPFFTTNLFLLTEEKALNYSGIDSFKIFIAYEGSAEITVTDRQGETSTTTLAAGHSLLLPADNTDVTVTPQTSRFAFLETYIK